MQDLTPDLKATQYPNGTYSWNEINPLGQLTALYNRHGSLSPPLPSGVPADASPLADFAYTYGPDGQRTQEIRSGGGLTTETTTYAYDELGRLKTVGLPSGINRSYAFDLDSNRTQIVENGISVASYTYDPVATPGVDQLTSVTEGSVTRNFAYNADGDTTAYGDKSLNWDGWGRHTGGSFGGQTVSYQFDPAGFRRQRASGATVTRYLHSGLFETDDTGAITLADVDGPQSDLAHYAGPPTTGTTLSFRYYNGHGDLAVEADTGGTRVAALTYDPFGAMLQTPPGSNTSERWSGRWDKKSDPTSGLVEMGARPYDPTLGRFVSVDPVDGGSANSYDFAYQDPVNVYDLDGRCVACFFRIIPKPKPKPPKPPKATKAAPKPKAGPPPASPTLGPMSAPQQTAYNAIVNDANKMSKIFDPKHHLDNMVHLLGSRDAVVREVVISVGRVPTNQAFNVFRIVSGSVLQIQGKVVNGVVRIGDFWRPLP